MAVITDTGNSKSLIGANLGAPIMVLMLLAMMIIPLPPILLDTFFSFSIALALVVLLVGFVQTNIPIICGIENMMVISHKLELQQNMLRIV